MYAGTHESYELFVHKYLITLLIASDDRQPRNETLGDYARSRYFIEGEDIHTYVYIRINYIYLYFADVVQCFYFARSSGITFQICGSFIQGVTAFVAFTEIAMISAPANINLWIFMTCYIYHSDVFFFADIIHTCVGGVTMTSLLRNKLAFVSYRAII